MKAHVVLAALLAFGAAGPVLAQAPAASPAAAQAAARPAASAARIDINQATEKQLDTLPGIGPARAKAIVAGRPYAQADELVSKKVLTQRIYDGLKDLISH